MIYFYFKIKKKSKTLLGMFISSPQFSATTLAGEPEDKSRSLWANAWALSLTVRLAVAFSAAGQGRIPMYVTLVHLQIIELWWRDLNGIRRKPESLRVCVGVCAREYMYLQYVMWILGIFSLNISGDTHHPQLRACVCACVCLVVSGVGG